MVQISLSVNDSSRINIHDLGEEDFNVLRQLVNEKDSELSTDSGPFKTFLFKIGEVEIRVFT